MIGLAEEIEKAERMFYDFGSIKGTLFFIPETRTIIQTNLGDEKAKENFIIKFSQYCERRKVIEFVLITEIWISRTAGVMPSQAKDRKEMLMCVIISKNGNQVALAEIKDEGVKRRLAGWSYDVDMEMESRWDICLRY